MKIAIGMMALDLALAACNKNEIDFQPKNEAEGIPFSATVSAGTGLDTRALAESGTTLQATWAVGETVALIHNGIFDEMTVSAVSGGTATITGTITGCPSDGDPVTIIYPSSAADGTTGNVKSDLLYAQDGTLTGTEGTSIAEKYDVRKGTGTLKVSETGSLNGKVSLQNQFAIFKFTVRTADGTTAVSAKKLTITVGTQDYVITSAMAADVLYAALPATSAQKVRFFARDVFSKTYTCTKEKVTFSAGKYYQSTLKMNTTSITMNGHDYVDMGTVVIGGVEKNLKWAICNVGADNPWDNGDYYAWGETATKSEYNSNWSNYFDTADGGNTFTKYNTTDGKKVLDLEDDAASRNWGGTWRIPTDEEWMALLDETYYTWEYIDDYLGDGSNHIGMIVTRKDVSGTDPCAGNFIFLPAAGERKGTILYDAGVGYGYDKGYYWSSSLYTNGSFGARAVYFDYSGANHIVSGRYYGLPIRPLSAVPADESLIEHEYVDMGYGMKWATMNIGANNPEESGDYFAWGETAPYQCSTYFDPDYQIYRWRSGPTLGRPIRLKREDDAASVLWGDDWRMPNYEECAMLVDQNKFTWAWNNAKKGYKVTSKQTGNSIFLPAAGRKEDETTNLAGVLGGFWASSSRAYGENKVVYASALNYSSVNTSNPGGMNNMPRSYGYSIRPIRVNKVNGHEYIDLGNGLGWALENLGVDDSHPSGRADTFAEGDPARAKWGAPWRTPTQAEWEWILDTDNCYREKSANYENAGLWFINQGSLSTSNSQLPDRAIFMPKTGEGYFLYWTSTRNADGKLQYVSVTDTYIKYIKSEDTGYQFVRPVFSLSELE